MRRASGKHDAFAILTFDKKAKVPPYFPGQEENSHREGCERSKTLIPLPYSFFVMLFQDMKKRPNLERLHILLMVFNFLCARDALLERNTMVSS